MRVFVPRTEPGRGGHDQDSDSSDQEQHADSAGDLGQQEVACKRQKNAETEKSPGSAARTGSAAAAMEISVRANPSERSWVGQREHLRQLSKFLDRCTEEELL